MGYLGNTPGESFISFAKQVFTIVNSQTAYTLNFSVVDENEIRLVINNVVQEPGTGKAYTASGTTLTLASALTNGTDEMYCVFLGKARETVTVPTITRDKLNLISDGSNPSLIAKGTSGVSEGYIQLNCAENSHGVKIKSPPHSAGQSYTLTLPQSISADTFLKTDGSGNLSFAAAGGTNTPAFRAINSSGQNLSGNGTTFTKVQLDTEQYDTASAYDNSSNYRFTVPSGQAGKYFISAQIGVSCNQDHRQVHGTIYKNGSGMGDMVGRILLKDATFNDGEQVLTITGVLDLSVGDYLELYGRGYDTTGGGTVSFTAGNSSLQGFKIIE
jgi:hypothetical protein